MLPFENRPWAKPVAAAIIVVSLVAAVCIPLVLHHRKALDPPVFVGIVLLLLAIIPPNILVLRYNDNRDTKLARASALRASRFHAN